jgi:hypothetical protein
MSEENKALVRREIEELFNHTGNLDVAEEAYASDFVGHAPTMPEGIHMLSRAPDSSLLACVAPSPT